MTRLITWFIRIVLVVIVLYALFFGNLLFLNPIKLGIRNKESERATVYTRNLYTLSPVFNFVDEYMKEAEAFYGLNYQNDISIYISDTETGFKRYLPPWILGGNNLESYTLITGNVLYFNMDKINEEGFSPEEHLKHELVHALIYQNTAVLNAVVIENQYWYAEGLAMYFAGPEYLTENEFASTIKSKELLNEERSYQLFSNLKAEDSKLNSSIYKYFHTFLASKYGEAKFKEFSKRYIASPGNYKVIFFELYNKRFKLVVDEFVDEYQ